MKKAFTLTEMLISLLIMGVLAAILIPSLFTAMPNKKKYQFKSAYSVLENLVNTLISDDTLYPDGNFENATASRFCNNVVSKINILGSNTCALDCNTVTELPCFTSSNGMKWWGFLNTFATTGNRNIWVDVNGDDGTGVLGTDILRLYVDKTGKISITDTTEMDYLKTN